MSIFRVSRRMEFCDTDMAGIVHFANFFRFMESAECAFLRSRGLGVILDWQGQAMSFPRVSATCDYLTPAKFEDVLDVDVAIERVGNKSITYAFQFSRDGEAIARGKVTSVCCRVNGEGKLESIGIPAGYRHKLEGAA
ncbi:MAG: acyl-CoA thioesterase [Planctomycetes bacterium]|nr:acyl-CoA thioesterase [Planctomycetota bacterium]